MAENLYCWRCDMVIPMLTEHEWEIMEPALHQAIDDAKQYREANDVDLREAMQKNYGRRALELYRELTGFNETNSNAIWHHRISLYGPACTHCGKPLRTPVASFCAACGTPRADR